MEGVWGKLYFSEHGFRTPRGVGRKGNLARRGRQFLHQVVNFSGGVVGLGKTGSCAKKDQKKDELFFLRKSREELWRVSGGGGASKLETIKWGDRSKLKGGGEMFFSRETGRIWTLVVGCGR